MDAIAESPVRGAAHWDPHPWLEEAHGAWIREVLAVIDAARAGGAGIWVRWGAICYLNDAFAKRLREVRAAVDRLRPFYSDEAATRLWATGELMDQLRLQLDRSVALHRSADEFGATGAKLLRALECWCREVEEVIRRMEWETLPGSARAAVARLGAEERIDGN